MADARVRIDLSPREREVLQALAEHRTNAEIAAHFVLSVRTVESHVASLLRKTGAANRQELAALGATAAAPSDDRRLPPEPPSSFIGRVAEQAALREALRTDRLATSVGPGGVGKTRLALAVAQDPGAGFPDGTVYVDLVPVADPSRVAAAIAAAAGVGAQQAATPEDALLAWLRGRRLLLVLDNCEHVVDGVAPLAERLLTRCPGLTVLATSRTRLLVPYERVVPVPGLSVGEDGSGDAVQLFRVRAEAQGAPVAELDLPRVAQICARLDGLALAIELAAARLPTLGLDGLEDGLTSALDLLEGGRRSDERHGSVRATLDWSASLLPAADRAALLELGVFATAFDATSVAALRGSTVGAAQAVLARLADSSLLTARDRRYLMLETVRQYGLAALDAEGALDEVRLRHLHWALSADLPFDRIAPELRAALVWASTRPGLRDPAFAVATRLAALAFAAGAPAEAQTRSEQAAAFAPDEAAAVGALRDAAGAAEARNVGLDAIRLHTDAAARAEAAGDARTASTELAHIAMLIGRAPGLMARAIPRGDAAAPLQRAEALAADDPLARAHVLVMRTFYGPCLDDDIDLPNVRRAIAAAEAARDPLLQGVAIDGLVAHQLAHRDIAGALAGCLRRAQMLESVPMTARTGIEFPDAYSMACECAFAAGDLPLSESFAERVRRLPMYAREPHLALGRTMTVGVLVGDWQRVVEHAPSFLDGWERAGRPNAGNLFVGSQAAAAAYAMVGDENAAAKWRALEADIRRPARRDDAFLSVAYEHALPLVEHGRLEEASALLSTHPDQVDDWHNGVWRPWYASLWAEVAVLAGARDAAERLTSARRHVTENPVAAALVDRAALLHAGEDPAPIADRLDALGARYQAVRTRRLADRG